ncbi:hypothetical protein L195_g036974, partial [Trifolium pratense]
QDNSLLPNLNNDPESAIPNLNDPVVPASRKRHFDLNYPPSDDNDGRKKVNLSSESKSPSSASSLQFSVSQQNLPSQVQASTGISCGCMVLGCGSVGCPCYKVNVRCSSRCECRNCENKGVQLSSTSLLPSSRQGHSPSQVQVPASTERHLGPSAIGVQATKEDFGHSLTLQIARENFGQSTAKVENCSINCKCIDCLNDGNHEDLVLQARMAIGCSCSKTSCKMKKCSCFKEGVGCSLICTCQGCENIHGRKG